jgi:hypothetical protein
MIDFREKICPKCHSPSMKNWKDLDPEQKMLAERLPASADYPKMQRKRHRFCTRCWFEEEGDLETRA